MSAMPPQLPPELASLLRGESSSASTPVAIGTPKGADGEIIVSGKGALKIGDNATVTDGSTAEGGSFKSGNTTILLHGHPLCGLGDIAIGDGKGIVSDIQPNLTAPTVLMSASGGGSDGDGNTSEGGASGESSTSEESGTSDAGDGTTPEQTGDDPAQLSETTGKTERAGDALNNKHTESKQNALSDRHKALSDKAEARQGHLDRAQRNANRPKNKRRAKTRSKMKGRVNHHRNELKKINKKLDDVGSSLNTTKGMRLLGKAPAFIDTPVVLYEAGTMALEGKPVSATLHITKDVVGDAAGAATTGAGVVACAGAGLATGPAGPVVFGACVVVAVGGGIAVSEGVGDLMDSTLGGTAESADAGFQQYVQETAAWMGEGLRDAADVVVETIAETAADAVGTAVDHVVDSAKETISDLLPPKPWL